MGQSCGMEGAPTGAAEVAAHEKLLELLQQRPYLERKVHPLHKWVAKCQRAIESRRGAEAEDCLMRLSILLKQDSKRLEAAFKKFDLDGSGHLEVSEFRHFVTYVGFGEDAVDAVLKASDRNKDGKISLQEFDLFVGRVGGIHSLLEQRRRLLDPDKVGDTLKVGSRVRSHFFIDGKASSEVWDARVLALSADGRKATLEFGLSGETRTQEVARDMILEDVDLVDALKSIGIADDAHHYWAILLPLEEQYAVKSLTECQRAALSSTRSVAKENHDECIKELMERAESLGISGQQLWSVLTWLRDLAPVIVMVDLDKVGQFFESDTHYRNQFETKTSNGLLSTGTRKSWEHDLFGGCYDDAKPFERPKYGVLDVMNDHRGVLCARQYGDSYMHLKNVRLRATFAPEDSGGIEGNRLAVLDNYAHVLMEYSDTELQEVARVANAPEGSPDRIGDSDKLEYYNYKEAQFHGEVDLSKHVQRLVVHPRHRVDGMAEDRIRAICEKHGWEFMWMDDEKKRRLYEERSARDGKAVELSWASNDAIRSSVSINSKAGGQQSELSQLLASSSNS
eukprot:TRINITY_DN14316_c0_g5_i1.p1 TRINITY_DN14316_c0_g5~~TRINITY_DN14316_c0_g5_i1.p1  ORF type:complete len:566 (-),score=150.77 TRINITY_DN14316_c0_g5_i1:7-1704(-)